MGLFDKTVKCQKCGKSFTKGLFSGDKLCPDCSWAEFVREQEENSIVSQRSGITQYYKDMPKKFRNLPADIDTIIASRDKMFQKYKLANEMNITVLTKTATNVDKMNDEQLSDFSEKLLRSLVLTQNKMSFALDKFVISHLYDGVAVDMDSVFAVAYTKNIFYNASIKEQPYLCSLFTNDPYFPAIGMTFLPVTSKSFLALEASKNKERVGHLQEVIPKMFRNLTYPVMDMKDMKKLVKQEGKVRGEMDPDLMLALLDGGLHTPFWSIDSAMSDLMPSGIATSIQKANYLSLEDASRWLNLSDKQTLAFWEPYLTEAQNKIDALDEDIRVYVQDYISLFS